MLIDDESRKKIRQQQRAYADGVKRIQANRDLSAAGKRKQLAALHYYTQQSINALVQTAGSQYEKHVSGLERKLFGIHDIPNDVQATIAWRDAQDRVAQLKNSKEGRQMMDRAIRSGDGILARALFERGWDLAGDRLFGTGWGDVANMYVEKLRPDLADTVQELAALREVDNKRTQMDQQIEASLFRPPELEGMTSVDIQRAALDVGEGDQGAAVEHLNAGAGQQQQPTVNEAWARFAGEVRDGVYGS